MRLEGAAAPFRYRSFRWFFVGALVSNAGTWMQNVTVPYVLFQLTHRGLWVGLAVVAQVLPSVFFNPAAGWLADRFPRRTVLLVTQAAQALAAAGLWLFWAAGGRSPVVILVLVAVGGIAFMLAQPAQQAFVTELVPREHLLQAITIFSAQGSGARSVGPAFAGIVLGTLGPAWAFFFNAVSFVVIIGALLTVPPPARTTPPLQGGVLAQFREAARHARGQRGLVLAFSITALCTGLGFPAFQLAAVFTERVYDVGPGKYGLLTAAFGVGAIVSAFALGTIGRGRRTGQLVRASVTLYGLAIMGFGLTKTFPQGVVLLALVGAGQLPMIATLNTAIQTQVPEALRGRVLGLWALSYTFAYPIGSLAEGWLADHLGPRPTVAGAGALLLAASSVLYLWPSLARMLDAPASAPDPTGAVAEPVAAVVAPEVSVAAPAATVVLLRDGGDGLETLLLRRSRDVGFAADAWVFPGGRVDDVDRQDLAADDEQGAARHAAVREAREETGLLLELASLVPFAHWTPPEHATRRYATWFFLAAAPDDAVAVDGTEIVDHVWVRPSVALGLHAAGEVELLPPTWVTLTTIGEADDVAGAMAAAGRRPLTRFVTRFGEFDGASVALWQGDAGYDAADAAAPGPRHRLWIGALPWRYERD